MQLLNDKIVNEPWYKEWRLIGAYVFYLICLFDFIAAPLIYVFASIWTKTTMTWVPLTTQGGGLFYMAYGGILGISAYGKFTENRDMMRIAGDQSVTPNQPGQPNCAPPQT